MATAMTPYVVKRDRDGTVRIYHRKLDVAVAEFYHHSAGDALAIKDILNGVDGLLPVEPPPAKAKAKGTLDEIAAFCESIGLRATDAEYFFNKCEGCGWLNGGKPIKDWKATIRSWKVAGYMPSQKQHGNTYQNGNTHNTRPSGGRNQPGRYSSDVR